MLNCMKETVSFSAQAETIQSTDWKEMMKSATRFVGRTVFNSKVTMAVTFALISVMFYHIVTISDAVAMGEAIAKDCLCALPWGLVAATRATLSAKEGGEL